MTKKLVIALVATSLLTLGACTKTSDESGAPVNQPGEAVQEEVIITPPANQPGEVAPQDGQGGQLQQPGSSPSPNPNPDPNY